MDAAPPPRRDEAVLYVQHGEGRQDVSLVEVEGTLRDRGAKRWSGLLRGSIAQGARGLAIDLRGCPLIDSVCWAALLAAAATLRLGGGAGVNLVVLPGSDLAQRIETLAGRDVATSTTATAALGTLAKLLEAAPAPGIS
jgi:anti-anti-sigma regulatory factor